MTVSCLKTQCIVNVMGKHGTKLLLQLYGPESVSKLVSKYKYVIFIFSCLSCHRSKTGCSWLPKTHISITACSVDLQSVPAQMIMSHVLRCPVSQQPPCFCAQLFLNIPFGSIHKRMYRPYNLLFLIFSSRIQIASLLLILLLYIWS